MVDAKHLCSPKHKLHGSKTEVSVHANGISIFVSEHHVGAVPDVNPMGGNKDIHTQLCTKTEWGKEFIHLTATEEGKEEFLWVIIAAKACIGASEDLRLMLPEKNPPRVMLGIRDKERNIAVSSDRIIVENVFGGLKYLQNLMSTKYRWDEDNYDEWMTLVVGFTNCNVEIRPLQMENRDMYVMVTNTMRETGEEVERAKGRRQEDYRRRKKRMLRNRRNVVEESD